MSAALLICAPSSRHPLPSMFTLFIPKQYHPLPYRSSSTYWVKPSLTTPANTNGLIPNSKSTIACIFPQLYFHLFSKQVTTYYVPGTVVGVADTAVNKTHQEKKSLASWSFHSTKGDSQHVRKQKKVNEYYEENSYLKEKEYLMSQHLAFLCHQVAIHLTRVSMFSSLLEGL